MIIHNPILTGSFTVNGTDVSSITSSAASITALNSYTASQNILNGTYTLTSSFAAQTASFTAFTSSILAQTASLNAFSASVLAQTASLNSFSSSVLTFTGSASTRLGALEAATSSLYSYTSSINNKTSSFATTGSNTFIGTQTISGSVLQSGSFTSTGTLTAQTLVVQTITSSVVYSSGSNIFGNSLGNSQTFTGSVLITGSLSVNGTSSIVGTGTTNYLPKFTGTSTIGNSAIFDNGTNVGIGTATPATKLQVNGNITVGASHFIGDNVYSSLLIQSSAGENILLDAQDELFLQTSGTSKLVIKNGGSVGIGTSSPSELLEIKSTSASNPNIRLYNTFNSGTSNYGLLWYRDYDSANNSIGAYIYYNRDGGAGGDMTFGTGTVSGVSERMRITSGGNVGIGTSSPQSALSFATTSHIGIATTDASDNGYLSIGGGGGGGDTRGAGIYMSGNERTTYGGQLAIFAGNAGASGFINFNTGGSEAMRITSGGQIYINTTSLRGTGYQTGQAGQLGAEFTNYGGAQWFTNVTNDEGTYLVLGKSRGTTVNSNTIVQNGDTLGALIFQGTDGSSTQNAAMIRANIDGTPGAGDMPGRLAFYTTADGSASLSERMRITSAGRVGIGQTAPGVALSVAGQSEAWQIAFTTATGTAGALIGSPSANVLAFGDWSGTERMRITSGGEVVRGPIREFASSVSPASPYTADLRLSITHDSWGGNADSGTVYVEYQGRAYGNNQTTTAFGVITYRLSDNGISVTNVSTAGVTVSSVTISSDVSSNYILRLTFSVAQSVDRASIFARTTNSFVSLISVDTV